MTDKAPAENRGIDIFNPVEVAGAGVEKSIEMLRMLLGWKQEQMARLKPAEPRARAQLAVATQSVGRRRLLAQELTTA